MWTSNEAELLRAELAAAPALGPIVLRELIAGDIVAARVSREAVT